MLTNKRETINHELTRVEWDMLVGGKVAAVIGVDILHDLPTLADAHINYNKFSVDTMRVTDDVFDEVLAFLDGMGVTQLFAHAPANGGLGKWIKYVNFLGFAYMGENLLGNHYACMEVEDGG